MSNLNRALFLDRDGIFNKVIMREGRITSPRNWREVIHYEGLDSLDHFKAMDFKLILVTNQPCIQTGEVSRLFVEALNQHYQRLYRLDDTFYCPFSEKNHPWRKPNPGMFFAAASKHRIDLRKSFHLGDTQSDTGAAKACGASSILWRRSYNQGVESQFVIQQLNELWSIL